MEKVLPYWLSKKHHNPTTLGDRPAVWACASPHGPNNETKGARCCPRWSWECVFQFYLFICLNLHIVLPLSLLPLCPRRGKEMRQLETKQNSQTCVWSQTARSVGLTSWFWCYYRQMAQNRHRELQVLRQLLPLLRWEDQHLRRMSVNYCYLSVFN